MTRSICLLACILCLVTGCSPKAHRDDPNSLDKHLKVIRYVSSSGMSQPEKRIDVNPSGAYRGAYKADQVEGKLTKSEKARLAAAFSGWEKLETSYPPRDGATNFIIYRIQYDDKIVSATDASPNLPNEFIKARKALEATIKFK
jgi:hypothetical protein